MRLYSLAALIVFLVTNLAAAGPKGHAVKLQGTVDRVTYDAVGSIDGLIFTDKVYLRFGTEAVQFGANFLPGDMLSASGIQVLEKPNPVVIQTLLKKGKAILVDDAMRAKDGSPNAAAIPEESLAKLMFPFRKESQAYVVGARADGQIDRVVLSDGITLEFPRQATIDPKKVSLGMNLSLYGVATSISGGRFGVALSIQDAAKAELLQHRVEKMSAWAVVKGIIKQRLHRVNGDLEGMLLADGTSVIFSPAMLPYGPASRLQPDVALEVAGTLSGKRILAAMIILSKDNMVIDPAAPIPRGRASGRASLGRGGTRARGH